jgi:hypothetical protein
LTRLSIYVWFLHSPTPTLPSMSSQLEPYHPYIRKFSRCIDHVSDKISNSPQDSLVRKRARHQNSLVSCLPRVPTIRAWCVLALLHFAACALALCLAGCALALLCLVALASGRSKSDSTAFSPPPSPSAHPRPSIPMNSNPEGLLMQENHKPMPM